MFKITEKDLKWLGIDFDKTLITSNFPEYSPECLVPGAKQALDILVSIGYKIVIFTSRPWTEYDIIEDFLVKNHVQFRSIVCGKLFCKYYIDDRNIEYSPDNGKDWNYVLDYILSQDKKGKV